MTKKYSPCARCGRPGPFRWGRVLQTGRIVCAKCYDDLPLGPGNLVIDDGIVRSWEETKQMKRKRVTR